MVAYGRLTTKENVKLLALKVVAVAYESVTGASKTGWGLVAGMWGLPTMVASYGPAGRSGGP